jgi:hypothetical protein
MSIELIALTDTFINESKERLKGALVNTLIGISHYWLKKTMLLFPSQYVVYVSQLEDES